MRSSNYASLEESSLAHTQPRISEDQIFGSEQNLRDFLEIVSEMFTGFKTPAIEERLLNYLKSREKIIVNECFKHSGCLTRVKRMKATDVAQTDIYQMEKANCLNWSKITEALKDYGKDFKYLELRKIISEDPKSKSG